MHIGINNCVDQLVRCGYKRPCAINICAHYAANDQLDELADFIRKSVESYGEESK